MIQFGLAIDGGPISGINDLPLTHSGKQPKPHAYSSGLVGLFCRSSQHRLHPGHAEGGSFSSDLLVLGILVLRDEQLLGGVGRDNPVSFRILKRE